MKSLKSSFTLIEILVVVVIVGVLSGIIIVGMSSASSQARDSKRRVEMDTIRQDLWTATNMGLNGYPTTPEIDPVNFPGVRGWCCVGLSTAEDPNCINLNSELSDFTLPRDPSYKPGNKEFCYMYKSNGTTFDLYTKLEGKGAISLSPDSFQITDKRNDCPANWIDTGLGFCVMKYEAKNVSGVATSQPGNAPWINISQVAAAAACKAIGAHLINNAEWMAIARDAESVSSNWNGLVMCRGHSDCSPANALSVSNPSDPYDQTGQSSPSEQRRTLTLSNGQTIWDFSGNVWEWVDYVITGAGSQPQEPLIVAFDWVEFPSIKNYGNTFGRGNIAPKDFSLDRSNGVGNIYYESNRATTHALLRSGYWCYHTYAGSFAASLVYSPASEWPFIGFRCAR